MLYDSLGCVYSRILPSFRTIENVWYDCPNSSFWRCHACPSWNIRWGVENHAGEYFCPCMFDLPACALSFWCYLHENDEKNAWDNRIILLKHCTIPNSWNFYAIWGNFFPIYVGFQHSELVDDHTQCFVHYFNLNNKGNGVKVPQSELIVKASICAQRVSIHHWPSNPIVGFHWNAVRWICTPVYILQWWDDPLFHAKPLCDFNLSRN